MEQLTIELVPRTSWFNNVRSHVTKKQWDVLRNDCYVKAHNKCEICGKRGEEWPVECHEVWEYNDKKHIQKLIRLIALCPACHEVKHIGLAELKGNLDRAIFHLRFVNKITLSEAKQLIKDAFIKWNQRSEQEWKVDISYLDKFK